MREGDGRVGACERADVLIGRCVCAWVQARFIGEGVRCEIACPSEFVSPKGEKKTGMEGTETRRGRTYRVLELYPGWKRAGRWIILFHVFCKNCIRWPGAF